MSLEKSRFKTASEWVWKVAVFIGLPYIFATGQIIRTGLSEIKEKMTEINRDHILVAKHDSILQDIINLRNDTTNEGQDKRLSHLEQHKKHK
jgi:hypothetical protein